MLNPIITLIPEDPQYVPDEQALDCAIEVLASFVEHADVSLTVQTEVEFINRGTGPAVVRCPACSGEVKPSWWAGVVKDAFEESRLANLEVTMPCCAAGLSLNELDYGRPAGFARFLVEIRNSAVDITDPEVRQLERCFGIGFRRI